MIAAWRLLHSCSRSARPRCTRSGTCFSAGRAIPMRPRLCRRCARRASSSRRCSPRCSSTSVSAPNASRARCSSPPASPCSPCDALSLGHRLELVADSVPRLDERVTRRAPVDLLPQPPHEDVDGAIAPRLAPPPELLQQLVARHDAAAVERELVEEAELGRSEPAALAVDVSLHLAGVDAQLLDLDRLTTLGLGRPNTSPCGCVHPRDELGHRQRDDLVVFDNQDLGHTGIMAETPSPDPFEELRVGFTAAVSHELRTPLA